MILKMLTILGGYISAVIFITSLLLIIFKHGNTLVLIGLLSSLTICLALMWYESIINIKLKKYPKTYHKTMTK